MTARSILSPAAFLKRHWRQKALAVHGSRKRTHPLARELLHGLRLGLQLLLRRKGCKFNFKGIKITKFDYNLINL